MKTVISFIISQSRFLKSLQFRIFILLMLVGLVPCIILSESIILNYRSRAVSVRTTEAINQCRILADHLDTSGYMLNPEDETLNAELEQLSSFYDGRIMVMDQDFSVISDTYKMSVGKTMISREIIDCYMNAASSAIYDDDNQYIEFTVPVRNAENGVTSGVMFASASTDTIMDSVYILRRKATIIIVTATVLIFVMAALLSAFLVRPFKRITRAISSVQKGFDSDAVSIPDYTETEAIMDAFNGLMERLKKLDDSREEFVSNVSHELKTPLASMKVLADSIQSAENVPVETYQEFMSDITEEVDRENQIITDLLSLVKMDRTAGLPNAEMTDINEMLEKILKRLRPIASKNQVDIVLESTRPVSAEVDQMKLSLAISNLVENAIKYNKTGGWVRVNLDADHQFFTLIVSDSGIGIPEESLDHIYERFYRVDKSHSREIGGTGLGLAITRNAILLHRGSIKATSIEGEGTTFTVRIPLKFVQ
ncbi:Signal transduction histidine kinase [Lachnospiraceae bacterium]|nr:Signal transduction histidine kinase [Lachnospiraceae bacterium]